MSLTTRDMEILSSAFQCLKDPGAFKVDYDKLASLAGFKTAASASNSFFLVRKKINAGGIDKKADAADGDIDGDANGVANGEADDDGTAPEPSTPKPKKPRVRKQKQSADVNGIVEANGEDGAAEASTPTPKKRGRKPKADPQSGDEATTPKKRGRKVKAKAEEQEAEEHSGDETMPATPATPTLKKRKNAKALKCEGENGDDAEETASPTSPVTPKKRGRKAKEPKDGSKPAAKRAKKSDAKVEDSNSDEAGEATNTAPGTTMEDDVANVTETTTNEANAADNTTVNEGTAAEVVSSIHGDGSSLFGPTSTPTEIAAAALKAVAAASLGVAEFNETAAANAAADAQGDTSSMTAQRDESELTELGPELDGEFN